MHAGAGALLNCNSLTWGELLSRQIPGRICRPEIWISTTTTESPIRLGVIHGHYWHQADILNALANVGFWGQSGQGLTAAYHILSTRPWRMPRHAANEIKQAGIGKRLYRRPKRFVSKKHEKCYAQCQRECTDAHDQHREQLTLGCTVIRAFAPTLKRCRSDE